ncbi:MAG TPA: hypothetical protein VF412_16955 [Bdellovibrio sp.]|uniref:hypothetical protein n=1 Tax=Bdellovibrio sp. TaxID=28201 RepID=UPI002F030B63
MEYADIEPLNIELRECLKMALEQRKSDGDEFAAFLEGAMPDIHILFERPVLVPCYILFGLAQELGIVNQVFKIITDYQLEYIRD